MLFSENGLPFVNIGSVTSWLFVSSCRIISPFFLSATTWTDFLLVIHHVGCKPFSFLLFENKKSKKCQWCCLFVLIKLLTVLSPGLRLDNSTFHGDSFCAHLWFHILINHCGLRKMINHKIQKDFRCSPENGSMSNTRLKTRFPENILKFFQFCDISFQLFQLFMLTVIKK